MKPDKIRRILTIFLSFHVLSLFFAVETFALDFLLQRTSDYTAQKPSVIEVAQVPGAIEFEWAFVAVNEPAGKNEIINIAKIVSNPGSEMPVIKEGDNISFYVEPGENTYVYIYMLDSSGNIDLIFPTSLDKNVIKSELTAGKKNYIPGKYEWFSVDDKKGTETYYLLASSQPLDKLEDLTKDYINAEGDQETTKQMILNEIKGQKKTYAFGNPVEEPISFGGRIRGIKKDIAMMAVEVKGKDFYSKTIKLKHE